MSINQNCHYAMTFYNFFVSIRSQSGKMLRGPVISLRRATYIIFLFPGATFLLSYQNDKGAAICGQWCNPFIFLLFHFAILLIEISAVNLMGEKRKDLLERPAAFRRWSAVIYAITPVLFVVLSCWLSNKQPPEPLSVYLLGLVAVFGGLTGLLISCEVNSERLTQKHLDLVYREQMGLIWPYTFAFVLTLIASPFVASIIYKGGLTASWKSLTTSIWIGMIGFATLIMIPLDNVRQLREEMEKRGFLQ